MSRRERLVAALSVLTALCFAVYGARHQGPRPEPRPLPEVSEQDAGVLAALPALMVAP